jgi:putative spermidine/putrescine transport system substrate-binding protein
MKKHLATALALLVALSMIAAVFVPFAAAQEPDYLAMSWDEIEAAAKEEGSVVFYMWWGEEFWKEAARLFTEKYGIQATVIIGEAVDKVLAEKDQPVGTVDVMVAGGTGVYLTVNASVWYGPIFDKMPSAAQLDQKLASFQEGVATGGYLVPLYRNQTGLLYDPDRVANPPQTWQELVEFIEQNPQQFAFCDPNKGGTGQAMVQTVVTYMSGGLERYRGDTEVVPAKVANWTRAWDWFNQHESQYVLTASNNESIDQLNQGAVSLIVAWDDDTQIALNKGTLFKRAVLYVPEFGMPGGGDTVGVLKNAPHKAAGMLFIDFLTSPEMQKMMNEMIGPYPARTDITDIQQLLPEEQRQVYGVSWYPAAYKKYANEEFTKNVLMR